MHVELKCPAMVLDIASPFVRVRLQNSEDDPVSFSGAVQEVLPSELMQPNNYVINDQSTFRVYGIPGNAVFRSWGRIVGNKVKSVKTSAIYQVTLGDKGDAVTMILIGIIKSKSYWYCLFVQSRFKSDEKIECFHAAPHFS